MSQPKSRKRIYTVLGLLTLLYTMCGFVLSLSTGDLPGRDAPATIGGMMVITGIPLFLVFLFLERRTK